MLRHSPLLGGSLETAQAPVLPTFTPSTAEAAEAEASTQQPATAPGCGVPGSKGQGPGSWDIVGGAGFPQRRLWPWVGWDVPVEDRRGVTPGGDLEERPAFLKTHSG